MEVFGIAVIILLMIGFGVGAITNAFKTSGTKRFDKTDVKYNDGDNT